MKAIYAFITFILLAVSFGACRNFALDETAKANDVKYPKHPMRIVSINPCVDAILYEIADENQIIGVSHYSQDEKSSSVDVKWAQKFQGLTHEAEEIIALKPDLVLSGSHVSLQTINQLKRLGIPLFSVASPQKIAESQKQITDIAQKIDQVKRGDELIAKLNKAIENAKPKSDLRPKAIMFQGGGVVPGAGTLADEMMNLAGFENIAPQYSQNPWNVLALEPLLNNPPQIMLSGGTNVGDRVLNHRALKAAKSKIYFAQFPSKYLNCAGSTMMPALNRLAEIHTQYESKINAK
jgi:iron complex transport system substrate-binding protein